MPRTTTRLGSLLMLVLVALSGVIHCAAERGGQGKGHAANLPNGDLAGSGRHGFLESVLWRRRKGHAPDRTATFTFVKEDMQATSPKFDVEDEHGVQWKVKLGEEPQSETAATRFLWAAGYFVDEDYYLASSSEGLPKLHRGEVRLSGRHGPRARLERKRKR